MYNKIFFDWIQIIHESGNVLSNLTCAKFTRFTTSGKRFCIRFEKGINISDISNSELIQSLKLQFPTLKERDKFYDDVEIHFENIQKYFKTLPKNSEIVKLEDFQKYDL